MYCLTVSYPKTDNGSFDFDYYEQSHLALVKSRLSPMGLQCLVVKKNVGSKPGGGDQYFASVDLIFDGVDEMNKALASAGKDINADIPNYTNVRPQYAFSAFSLQDN